MNMLNGLHVMTSADILLLWAMTRLYNQPTGTGRHAVLELQLGQQLVRSNRKLQA